MVALDTNVIVRYLVRDNLEQAEAARGLVEGLTSENPGFICRESMVEIAWVLKRVYRFSRAQISETLVELTASESIVVECSEEVAAAAYRYGEGGAEFADLMILSAAVRAGTGPLYTFDRKLSRMKGAVLVEAEGPRLLY